MENLDIIKSNESYLAALEEVVKQDPQDLGYSFNIWTTERLWLHLKALLKENDPVYWRPKHDLSNLQDEKAHQGTTMTDVNDQSLE